MPYNPLDDVIDEPLSINDDLLEKLRDMLQEDKFSDLPGDSIEKEKWRLSEAFHSLIDILVNGLEEHPSKLWVMKQFQLYLEGVEKEDTEARERFGTELENIMDVLGIESSNGLLACYLGGI